MTGLAVTVPHGFEIVRARPTKGWIAAVEGSTATWSGGPLAHLQIATFLLDVDVTADPGPATIDSRQLYPGGESVMWPATLTVVPGRASESGGRLVPALIVGLVGLAVASALGLLVWHRRTA